jgi:DUF1365 family protein
MWFCHDAKGNLVAVLAEVNNTFGERHNYLLANADGRPIRDGERIERRKVFHVSPFMAIDGHYHFRFHARSDEEGNPAWRLARIDHGDAGGDLLHTSISGHAEPLDYWPPAEGLCPLSATDAWHRPAHSLASTEAVGQACALLHQT